MSSKELAREAIEDSTAGFVVTRTEDGEHRVTSFTHSDAFETREAEANAGLEMVLHALSAVKSVMENIENGVME